MGLREDIIAIQGDGGRILRGSDDLSHDLKYLMECSIDVEFSVHQEDIDPYMCASWALDIAEKTNKLPPQPSAVVFFHGNLFSNPKNEGLLAWEVDDERQTVRIEIARNADGSIRGLATTPICMFKVEDGELLGNWVRDEKLFVEEQYEAAHEYCSRMYIAFVGLLALKQVETERKPAPKTINANRVRKGKPAISERVIVRLGADVTSHARGGTHASPRPHWRRGHVRRLANGKIVMVSPHAVMGYAEQKDYTIKV